MLEALLKIGVILIGLLLSAGLGWLLVGGALRFIVKAAPAGDEDGEQRQSLRGGTWIGILERLAVTAVIVSGQMAMIAVVVAVKGFGRFNELKDNPVASEKFVVGTLASLLWAAAMGALTSWVLLLI